MFNTQTKAFDMKVFLGDLRDLIIISIILEIVLI